ncbi:hypothetical protein SAY87_029651 [Trapa incisa]|uniref:Immediate early response 3-interacting protein 1 n=1 Tax=Trapa incisa TaxID=236973 RepID=A0AAN7KDA3_9MYRT|nr:hypothetical protein SAY87_029651 [Trapa incisa]
MGLWTLLEGLLLIANAFSVLNEDRFLSKRGWSMQEFPGGRTKSLKGQFIGLIYAMQYLRVPLIILNGLFIIVKMAICPSINFVAPASLLQSLDSIVQAGQADESD